MTKILILLLFFLQGLFITRATVIVNKNMNPFIVLFISILIAVFYFRGINPSKEAVEKQQESLFSNRLIGLTFGALVILFSFWALRRLFWDFPQPGTISDVIPQIEALYTRFKNGVFPYYPFEQYAWHPYPVYMPMHWFPLVFADLLNVDVRWSGAFLLVISSAAWGYFVWKQPVSLLLKTIAIILPSYAIWAYILWDRGALGVSFELVIAAYYLLLAIGLANRNIVLTALGVVLCLLSRYTLVFWLPLFAVLLWMNEKKKVSYYVWSGVAISFLVFYVLPFLIKDTTILSKGLAYHNGCAVAEWTGFGEPPISWTFESGVYFAEYFRDAFPGSMEHRVFLARVMQASLMLALLLGGLLVYRKLRAKLNFYDFSLGMLYLFILCFYMFGPLMYKYYYMPLLTISAVMCGKILMTKKPAGKTGGLH